MKAQTLLNRPQVQPKITPRITRISGLVGSSNDIKKSSAKLRKIFEKGTYQKKTQLNILNRYKRRLDSIQKQNDKKFTQKKSVKIKLPDIKKYAGNFFTAGSANDPLKAIATLAAFNSASKAGKGDWMGAVGPGLVAAGLLFGPSLIKGGISRMVGGTKGGPQPTSTQASAGMSFKSPYAQTKAGKAYAAMQAERNLPKWAQRAAGGSASRFAASNERMIQGTANIGDRARLLGRRFGFGGIGGAAENIANLGKGGASTAAARGGIASAGKGGALAGRLIPGIATLVNLGIAGYRLGQGDYVGAALSGLSAIPLWGWAAVGVDIAREMGAFDGTFLGRKDKLKEQTQKQKELIKKEQNKGGGLTFGKTLTSYERVVNKFEEFVKGFKDGMGMSLQEMQQTAAKIEDLGGGSNPISAAGHEFTNQPSFSQYLTGDPSSPGYDPAHGGANYHEHLAFKDQDTARRAYEFLKSKGIKVTEFGVSSGHAQGSAHYSGRAFDVPADQVPVGQERQLSAKVRAFMNDFYNIQNQRTPAQQSRGGRPSTANQLRSIGQSQAARAAESQQSLFSVSSDIINESVVDSSTIQPTTPPVRRRSISTYPSYDSRSQAGQIIPLPIPIPQQQPQMMQQNSSAPMIMGPSEEQVLNSFYKRILLNTVV